MNVFLLILRLSALSSSSSSSALFTSRTKDLGSLFVLVDCLVVLVLVFLSTITKQRDKISISIQIFPKITRIYSKKKLTFLFRNYFVTFFFARIVSQSITLSHFFAITSK
jgi:hypothetical protein